MACVLETATRQVGRFLAHCEPARYSGDDAVAVLRWAVALERQAQGLKLLFYEPAARSLAWAEAGCTSPEQWFAQLSKAPLGEAISTAETAKALGELPGTTDAVREGKLSRAQTQEITKAAAKDPASEAELLRLAGEKNLKDLRHRARQLRHQAASRQDEAARYRQIAKHRALRSWSDPEGATCLQVRLTPDAAARALSAIDAEAEAVFDEARREGRREPYEAYRADAFVRLVTATAATGPSGSSERRRRGARDQVLVLVEVEALKRGHVEAGERCEVAGVGPVPVSVARRIADAGGDLWLIYKEALDIGRLHQVGRTITKAMQVAVTARDEGRCQVPGCDATHNLEAHHWKEPYSVAGTTSLDNLVLVCPKHHDLITYGGWSLEGGPGHWRFRGPPEEPPERIFDTG